ncbi:MAG: FtsX-like permease family protein [Tannerellaceae bacterium]
MRNLLIALRSVFKKGRHNEIKIVSLGVGLAVGLVLIAKVYFEQSYDDFFPDGDRIYQVQSVILRDGELKEWQRVSGAITPGMKAEIPEVEAATRFTSIGDDETFTMLDTKKKYVANFVLADSCLFDLFPRRVLIGNVKEVLSRPMYVMVSKKMADRIGGNVVGKTLEIDSYPDRMLTIGGVFEEVPDNSHLDYDVLVSMPSIGKFMFDGSMNWLGNDRYSGYVKLMTGATPESIKPGILRMQEKNQPEIKDSGVDLTYSLHALTELHDGTPEVKRMMLLLSLLAFTLIFTAVMNYILVVISSIVNRSREVAVHKCYGASSRNIHGMILSETLVHLLLSLALSVFLIFVFRETVESLLDVSLSSLLLSKGSVLLLGVCLLVFFATGLIPGYLFTRIPVASAFRKYRENRRVWKLVLLFFQFIFAGFLVTLLVIIGKQYTYMVNDDPGYSYERLAYCSLAGVDSTARAKLSDELMRLPEVERVTPASDLPFNGHSGNNIYLPGDDRELFNIADLYSVGDGYLDMMNIPVIEGRSFTEQVTTSDEVMVSRSFLAKIARYVDWKDGVVGKSLLVTEHSQDNKAFTICGVYEDFRLGSISDWDERPSVMFYGKKWNLYLMVKFQALTPEAMRQAQAVIKRLLPDKDITLLAYKTEMTNLYSDSRNFRDAVLIGGLVTLLISLIGLIGYVNDEINRRRSELAIRKVNGATLKEILALFLKDIVRLAVCALLAGGAIAYVVASKWQDQFSEKVALSWYIFVGCGVLVLLVILFVAGLNCWRAANENPVNCLKSE